MTEIAFIDLFSGIGGFAEGFQRAGLKFKFHAFSEIDKNAINIYKKHFPNAQGVGDVRTVKSFSKYKNELGGVPLVVTFGFPCQDLSVAGKRRGLAGARSGLFFEALRIIRELRPDVFIFENVKGLLSSNGGSDFIRCLQEIADLGVYACQWQLVNTCWILPQNRERIYFIGCLGKFAERQIFPLECGGQSVIELQREPANTITAKNYTNNGLGSYIIEGQSISKVNQINMTPENHQQDRVYSAEGFSPALNTGTGGNLQPKILCYPRGKNKGGIKTGKCPTITSNAFEQNNFIVPVMDVTRQIKNQNGRRFKNAGDPSFTITTQGEHGIYDGARIRKLTPLECERLQGFPDNWTAVGADGAKISDSARYRAVGNAVTTCFPELIAKKLFKEC